jgi:hypothetical protein
MMHSSSKKRTRALIKTVETLPQSTRAKSAASKVATTIDLTNDSDIVLDDDDVIAQLTCESNLQTVNQRFITLTLTMGTII